MKVAQHFTLRLNTETWASTVRLSKNGKCAERDGNGGIHWRAAKVTMVNEIFVGENMMRLGNKRCLVSSCMEGQYKCTIKILHLPLLTEDINQLYLTDSARRMSRSCLSHLSRFLPQETVTRVA